MLARLGIPLCFGLLCAATPAFTAEVWDCTVTGPLDPTQGIGEITIQIEGETLYLRARGIPPPGLPHRVLEDNAVGVVASITQSRVEPNRTRPGKTLDVIGANIFLINKVTGDFRNGTVMAVGLTEIMTGHCVRQ